MAFIDFIVGFVILVFVILGIKTGFIRGFFGSIATYASLIIAVTSARPLATSLNERYSWAEALSGLIEGGGGMNEVGRGQGMLMLMLVTGLAIFLVVRILIAIVKRFLSNAAQKNKVLGRLDRILGVAFGLFRFMIFASLACGIVFFITRIGLFSGLESFLFTDSVLARWIYDLVVGWIENAVTAALT